jgi:hypothetical protein
MEKSATIEAKENQVAIWTPAEIAATRRGNIRDPIALWLHAMQRACTNGEPHYRRYVDPRTGRTLAETPPCMHAAP